MSYSEVLGQDASCRLQKKMLPGLVWNQEIYGTLLVEQLSSKPGARWLDAGCGHRILAQGLERIEDSAVAAAGSAVGMDPYAVAVAAHRNIKNKVCGFIDKLPFADEAFDV